MLTSIQHSNRKIIWNYWSNIRKNEKNMIILFLSNCKGAWFSLYGDTLLICHNTILNTFKCRIGSHYTCTHWNRIRQFLLSNTIIPYIQGSIIIRVVYLQIRAHTKVYYHNKHGLMPVLLLLSYGDSIEERMQFYKLENKV